MCWCSVIFFLRKTPLYIVYRTIYSNYRSCRSWVRKRQFSNTFRPYILRLKFVDNWHRVVEFHQSGINFLFDSSYKEFLEEIMTQFRCTQKWLIIGIKKTLTFLIQKNLSSLKLTVLSYPFPSRLHSLGIYYTVTYQPVSTIFPANQAIENGKRIRTVHRGYLIFCGEYLDRDGVRLLARKNQRSGVYPNSIGDWFIRASTVN